MSTIATMIKSYEFNRGRTLGMLEQIEKLNDPAGALAWRPAPGRAHAAWQFMHIGICEEMFATKWLAPHKSLRWPELWTRFGNGSQADDQIPTLGEIRTLLADGRAQLLDTLAGYTEDRLSERPEAVSRFTVGDILNLITFHEGHHHGQAHSILNGYRAAHPATV